MRGLVKQADFNKPKDYIHWTFVRSGWLQQIVDWLHPRFITVNGAFIE